MSDDFGLWEVFLSMFWFMLLFAWIWMLIAIFGDIFRDHELSGWGKALWSLLIIFLPWIGVLAYLIARGRSMNERSVRVARGERQELPRLRAGGIGPTESGGGAPQAGGAARQRRDHAGGLRPGQGQGSRLIEGMASR